MDDLEMQTEVQAEVTKLGMRPITISKKTLLILKLQKRIFRLFGFEFEDVDYEADVDIEVSIEVMTKLFIIRKA
jgi:enoyl-[acyl-carrier protein] reductase/trans-2-enoyl-CoA reductase (NAD+)